MPVDVGASTDDVLFQRDQYAKGGVARAYWDYKDERIMRSIGPGRRILDVGCGEGILLEKLVARFPDREVSGVDIYPLNINICREHHLPVAEGSAYALPFDDGVIDTAVFMEIIEHLEHPMRALAELNRVLRPGGRLLVLFPNDLTFKLARVMMLMFKEAFYDPGHLQQWTPGSMKEALVKNGFRVLKGLSMPLPLFAFSLHHLTVAEKI